jgi:hypothetical protein
MKNFKKICKKLHTKSKRYGIIYKMGEFLEQEAE